MKDIMKKERLDYLRTLSFNQINSMDTKYLTMEELEWLIRETALSDENKHYCVEFFMERLPIKAVADRHCVSIATANRRKSDMRQQLIITLVETFFGER